MTLPLPRADNARMFGFQWMLATCSSREKVRCSVLAEEIRFLRNGWRIVSRGVSLRKRKRMMKVVERIAQDISVPSNGASIALGFEHVDNLASTLPALS